MSPASASWYRSTTSSASGSQSPSTSATVSSAACAAAHRRAWSATRRGRTPGRSAGQGRGDVTLRVPGGDKHQWYRDQPLPVAVQQLGDRLRQGWRGQFDEAAGHRYLDPAGDALDELAELRGAVRVGGTVSGDQQRGHASGSPYSRALTAAAVRAAP